MICLIDIYVYIIYLRWMPSVNVTRFEPLVWHGHGIASLCKTVVPPESANLPPDDGCALTRITNIVQLLDYVKLNLNTNVRPALVSQDEDCIMR